MQLWRLQWASTPVGCSPPWRCLSTSSLVFPEVDFWRCVCEGGCVGISSAAYEKRDLRPQKQRYLTAVTYRFKTCVLWLHSKLSIMLLIRCAHQDSKSVRPSIWPSYQTYKVRYNSDWQKLYQAKLQHFSYRASKKWCNNYNLLNMTETENANLALSTSTSLSILAKYLNFTIWLLSITCAINVWNSLQSTVNFSPQMHSCIPQC